MAHVIRKQFVAGALAQLRAQKTHTLFAGYLYLQQRASQLRRLEDLQPEFLPFFKQFFYVENHPLGAPYIKPFTEHEASAKNLWLKENVAGSYAPSSLRAGQPFRRVVQIEGRRYSLPKDHAARAFEHLLFSTPVQAAELAAFLYRDFGLVGHLLDVKDLVDIFAYEFGYASHLGAEPDENFRTLYSLDTARGWEGYEWLEPLPGELDEPYLTFGRTPNKVRSLSAEDLLAPEPEQAESGVQTPLRELLVEGLLSFGERTELTFGQLNILVGPNGSGKSNLIDCVRVFRNAPFDIQETFKDSGFEDWLYRGLAKRSGRAFLQVTANIPGLRDRIRHQIRLGPPTHSLAPVEELLSSARAEDESVELYFVSSTGSATLSVTGAGRRRREREMGAGEYDPFRSILSQIRDVGQYPEITRLASLYAGFRIYSEWTFGRASKLREATTTGRSDARLSESMDDLAMALNALERTSAHDAIRGMLKELKETYLDYVTRILFGRVGLELVEAPFELPLPAARLSDGTLRFLALAAILLQPDPPPLICLEEPELGMHPDMIRMVAKMIVDASAKAQLIVSTHSEHLLTALQDEFDVLFAFDAGPSGSSVRQFSRDEFKDWRQDHTLGELWTSGELGGNRW